MIYQIQIVTCDPFEDLKYKIKIHALCGIIEVPLRIQSFSFYRSRAIAPKVRFSTQKIWILASFVLHKLKPSSIYFLINLCSYANLFWFDIYNWLSLKHTIIFIQL